MRNEELSKIISHALRHKPEDYNLKLSKDGWVSLDELVSSIKNKVIEYSNLKSDDIVKLVSEATKRRHEIRGCQIRALHGHSVEIKTRNCPLTPPAKLFHATALSHWHKIKQKGLDKMKRNYIHLSTHKKKLLKMLQKNIKTLCCYKLMPKKLQKMEFCFIATIRIQYGCVSKYHQITFQ